MADNELSPMQKTVHQLRYTECPREEAITFLMAEYKITRAGAVHLLVSTPDKKDAS